MRMPRNRAGAANGELWSSAIWRAIGFFAFWLVLGGFDLIDLPAAAGAVAAATWMSLRLLPPAGSRGSPGAIARLTLLFLYQSVIAGADVARRALDPRLPLRPGFVVYPIGLPPGAGRNLFATLTSLLPGTVPAGEQNGQLVFHCLDTRQPVLTELAAEEEALKRALNHV